MVVLVQAAGEQVADLVATLLVMGKGVAAIPNLSLRPNQEEQLFLIIKMAIMV